MEQPGRITNEADLLAYLTAQAIPYQRAEHPPVFTCEEAERYRPAMPGLDTKNLLVRDERRRFYLLVTACQKRLDLRALGQLIGAPKLHFASPAELLELLGLTPGSVTVLGLVNDPGGQVQLLMDGEYWPAPAYLCHPLVNSATLSLAHPDLLRFLERTGHTPRMVVMPARL